MPKEQGFRGKAAEKNLRRVLSDAGYSVPKVHRRAVEHLKGEDFLAATEPHFGHEAGLSVYGGYGLEFGFPGRNRDGEDNSSLLHRYWEHVPEIPDMFLFGSRSNGYGLAVFILARGRGAFVSQQNWFHYLDEEIPEQFNRCTDAYNEYMVPALEDASPSSSVIVVFSSYRRDALILSTVERSWIANGDALSLRFGPAPAGFGVVFSRASAESDRETHTSLLTEIAGAEYSPEVSAAAHYMSVCLAQ